MRSVFVLPVDSRDALGLTGFVGALAARYSGSTFSPRAKTQRGSLGQAARSLVPRLEVG